ncbi:MAG: hypothetical protein MUE56_02705 [Ignavibacteria bacterium]|jgi:hypothetical protein|nr:hypothetical protein [Ignavibacteria bacterium]
MNENTTVSIICKGCGRESEITNPSLFFNSDVKRCINCNALIETGSKGIDEQILLLLRKNASAIPAIVLCREVKNMSLKSAKQYVEFLARQNGIKFNTGVNRSAVFILALAIAMLVLGIALVSLFLSTD